MHKNTTNGQPPLIQTEASMRADRISNLALQLARHIDRLPPDRQAVIRLKKKRSEWHVQIEFAQSYRDMYLTKR